MNNILFIGFELLTMTIMKSTVLVVMPCSSERAQHDVKLRKDVLNILIECGMRVKLVECLNEMCYKIHIVKSVSYPLPNRQVTGSFIDEVIGFFR
jgi:hypothetical protein